MVVRETVFSRGRSPRSLRTDKKRELTLETILETVMMDETIELRDGLTKTIKVAGTGSLPEEGNMCAIQFTGTLDDGTVFDSTQVRSKGRPTKFRLGLSEVILGLDIAVSTMHVGEKAIVQVPTRYAYGMDPPKYSRIPPNADLTYIVTLEAAVDDTGRQIRRQVALTLLFGLAMGALLLFLHKAGF